MEEGSMAEDAKDASVETAAKSPVEESAEKTPESDDKSSGENSQREDTQGTPEAAEVLEEQEPLSVDATEFPQMPGGEGKQTTEDDNDEGDSSPDSPAETAKSSSDAEVHEENACGTGGETSIAISNDDDEIPSEDMAQNHGVEGASISSIDASRVANDAKPLDVEDGVHRRDDGTEENSQTQPNAPQSDINANSNTCANDVSEEAIGTCEDGDGDVNEEAKTPPCASLDTTDSNPIDKNEEEEGNDKTEITLPGMKGPKGDEVLASPTAASPSSISDQKEDADINGEGGSPQICPCVRVTSNLIGMSLGGRSGSERRRRRQRRQSGLTEDYKSSGHSKTSLLGNESDRSPLEREAPSYFSPTATPSRSPNRRRRRPGISPLRGATSGSDTNLGISVKGNPSEKKNINEGTQDDNRQRSEDREEDEFDVDSTPSAFLAEHHSNHFLCMNLTGSPADRETASSFNNQIINCPWTAFDLSAREVEPAPSSGDDATTALSSADKGDRHRSPSTPSLAAILDICYTIAAYQSLGSQNVACVYCENGRTRTGVAIACFLKYEGRVRTSLDGFRLFCAKCNDSAKEEEQCRDEQDVASLIPPSLLQLFRNFDDLVDLRTWPNQQPLRLRAVTMQGVPVDDLPVVEIWTGAKGQIYTSHGHDCGEFQSKPGLLGAPAQWGCDNEEGFYLIDKDIQGEFTLTCRFGGGYADDTHDPARILFRVTNHCAFFTWGPNELRRGKVDIMRRYADSFEDDFSLVLLFEPVGGLGLNSDSGCKTTAAKQSYLPPIKGDIAAIEQGLRLIAEYHSLQTEGVTRSEDDGDELASNVARRLTNNDDVSLRQALESPQMVGVQKAIRAYKSRLTQDEKVRFNPIMPTSEASNAIKTEGTENKNERCEEEKGSVDPRAALLSAIKSNGSTRTKSLEDRATETNVRSPEKGSGDPRAALLGAIKARKSAHIAENGEADSCASVLSSIKTRERPEDGDEKSEKEEIEPSSQPIDPRAAMLSAIKAKKSQDSDKDVMVENVSKDSTQLDPRAAMLSAIKARQKPATDETTEEEETKASVPSLDPRAAMLSAIKARQSSTEADDGKDISGPEGPKREAVPSLDPRAAMLSAIKARQKPAEDETTEKEETKPSVPPLDPRAAMLSAIKARQTSADSKNNTGDARSSDAVIPAFNSNDRLITAIKTRGTDDKSSQLLDLLDGIAFGCDSTMELESSSHTGDETEGRFHSSTADYAPYDQSFTPSPGDVVKAFGSYPSSSKETDEIPTEASRVSMSRELYPRPHLPLHPSLGSKKLRPMQQFLAQFESREDIASCIELLDKMPRSGIQIDDLMHLLAQSRRWSKDELNRIQQSMAIRQGAIADASLSREGAAANAAAALAGQFQIASDSSGAGGSTGPSKGAQAAADAVSQRLENNASVSQIAKDINQGGDAEDNKAGDDDGDDGMPKLKDDPIYSKYFRMLKVGLPVGAVKNALQRDGQDPSIMDLDQNRPIQIQLDERNKYRQFEMSEWM